MPYEALDLNPEFPPPEFDTQLCAELFDCISASNDMSDRDTRALAVKITVTVDFYCAAFNHHFIDSIDELVGSEEYSLRVYAHREQPNVIEN